MKKSIFIAVLGAATAVAAYGQGQINFSNYSGGSTQTTGITYANGPDAGLGVGSEISVELLYGNSTSTLISQLTPLASSVTVVGINGVTTPSQLGVPYAGAGVFQGPSPVVPGTAGSTYAFAIYAFGTLNGIGYSGYSGIFNGATQSTSLAATPNLPNGLYTGSFTVSSVPEPTTMALGGLGLAALLVARRKKV